MKYDWNYVTKDRAKMNIALTAAGVISKFAQENEPDKIVGACMLMDALIDTLEDDEDDEDVVLW